MSETERYWKARVARRYTQFTDLEKMAEQAVRELEATIERLRDVCQSNQRAWIRERAKVEAAKAEADERAKWWREYANETEGLARWSIDRERADLAQAEATIERLKVCGNCDNLDVTYDEAMDCVAGDTKNGVSCYDRCHFTPSRWAERGGE